MVERNLRPTETMALSPEKMAEYRRMWELEHELGIPRFLCADRRYVLGEPGAVVQYRPKPVIRRCRYCGVREEPNQRVCDRCGAPS